MKSTLKTFNILSCTLYTLCAAESPTEKVLAAPPLPAEKIATPTEPVLQYAPQIPGFESVPVSPALLPAAPNSSPAVLSLTPPLATSAQQNTIKEFIAGFSKVMSTTNDAHGQNVHALDPFMQEHIPTHLLKTLQDLKIGDNTLTKEEIIAKLKEKSPDELRYENTKIPKAIVCQYVGTCVNQAFTQQQTQELFSRYVALLTNMDDQDHYNTLLSSIAENYATGGGCWPGVRNRCAISLAHLLSYQINA